MSRIRVQHPRHYALALKGEIPAEALSTADRGRLLWHLYGAGMSVEDIAAHTRTTDHTVHRILTRQGEIRQHQTHHGGAA